MEEYAFFFIRCSFLEDNQKILANHIGCISPSCLFELLYTSANFFGITENIILVPYRWETMLEVHLKHVLLLIVLMKTCHN